MVRMQIQLPDEVYARAKRVAEVREISLAELTRRGLEYILGVYAPPETKADWAPPRPRRLGWRGLGAEKLKEEAQRTRSEVEASGPGEG